MHPARDENQNRVGDEDEASVKFIDDAIEKPPSSSSSSSSSSSLSSSSPSVTASLCSLAEGPAVKKRPPLPDGGWGWMVVLASLVISMIADGISFSFGLLYIEFLIEFGESKSKTSWIGSLFMAVPLISGPVMSALVDRYGCRRMTMLGGVVSAAGFVMSTRVRSIELMYLTFGVLAGLGLGLCYVTAIVSIAYWFDKRRGLAVGLGACGTGIGTFVYAPLTQHLVEQFGWRGCTLLLAGTFLNMCVCGALMRDPDWLRAEHCHRRNATASASTSVSTASDLAGLGTGTCPPPEGWQRPADLVGRDFVLTALSARTHAGGGGVGCRSAVSIPTFVRQSERVPLEVLEALSANRRLCNLVLENYPSLLSCRSASDRALDRDRPPDRLTVSLRLRQTRAAARTTPPSPKKSLPSNYLRNIRVHKNSVVYRGAMLNIHKYRLRASSCPDIFRNSMTTLANESQEKWYADTLQLLKGMADFSMFLELHFLLMSVSTVLLYTWFIVPYFYLAELLTRVGYSETDASQVLSVVGVTNTVGMVALGWAGDQPWMPVTKTYVWCLVVCGLSIVAMIACTPHYGALLVASGVFGLSFASNYSLTPAILVELVPLDRFTTAYGLILLCQGIGNLLGPPLAGWIFDVTGTWDASFLLAGVWIVVAGLLIAVIPFTVNRRVAGSGPLHNDKGLP